jgi:hypothetical protein
MWLQTAVNTAEHNFVEVGMTAGTLYAAPGQPQGFMWYWTDFYNDTNDYYEHYIMQATAGTWDNVSIYWEGNSYWGVWVAGFRVGGSGIGAYPGNVDAGVEMTTPNAATEAFFYNWQKADKNWSWNWTSPNRLVYGDSNLLTAFVNTAEVTAFTPHYACGAPTGIMASKEVVMPTPPAPPPHRPDPGLRSGSVPPSPDPTRQPPYSTQEASAPAAPSTQQRADLTAIAQHMASIHKEQNPVNIRYTASTRQAALTATTRSRPTGDVSVYVIQMEGHFQKQLRHTKEPLLGTSMTILVDAQTGQVTDWSIAPEPDDLSQLGPATSL